MEGKFLKIWSWTKRREKPRSGMSSATRLVIRYKLLSTFLTVSTAAAFQSAPQSEQAPALQAQQAMVHAIEEGRLVWPVGNSAWDHYQRYVLRPLSDNQRHEADDRMVIALGSAGDQILFTYRRGNEVIPLGAAKYEEGARLFGYASEIDPLDLQLQAKAKFMEGQLLIEKHEHSEGIQALRQSIVLDPNAAYAYNALGIVYLQQKRWKEAVANFRAATERAEMWVYPRFNLFRAYTRLNRLQEAERELRTGIEIGDALGTEYSYLHYNLAVLYLYQGRFQEADVEFRHAERT